MIDMTRNTRGPIAWMASNGVAANLLMFVFLIGGLITAARIKQEVFPDFDLDIVSVTVPYPGASPEEVERGIVLVLEENVRGLVGVGEVTASAREGAGSISVELLEGADPQKIYQDIQQEVARIRTFPDEAEEPIVSLVARKREVLDLALYGDVQETVLRQQADLLRDRLLEDAGITQVDLSGIRDYQITVSIPRDTLRAYGLTLDEIARRIESLALELPGGSIRTNAGEVLLRMKERRDFGDEFAELPIITTAEGSVVRLADIAEITDGFDEDDDRLASWNGKPAVMVNVYRVGEQTPLQVSKTARAIIDEYNEELPPGMGVVVRRDLSEIYKQRLELLSRNGMIGLTFVILVLALFLEIKLAFWVMMGIPISFLGGLLVLPLFGVSINMISMFAFLIALGIVVDDAIVVGENVYEHLQQGDSPLDSAIAATHEVAMPVTFSILTNIIAFMPLMFLPGFIGKIWVVIPIVVMTVFAISLIECLYVLPAHLSHGAGGIAVPPFSWLHAGQQAFSRFFMFFVRTVYGAFLRFALRNRYVIVAVGVAVLVLTVGFVASRRIGMVPMMRVESDYATVTAALPYGAPVENTLAVQKRLVATADEVGRENGGDQLLRGVYAEVGRSFRGLSGGHVVEVRAYLTDPDVRPISTSEFTRLWRERTGPVPGVETILFEADRGGPGSGVSLSIQLSHRNSDTLDRAAEDLAKWLEDYPIVSDIDDGFAPGKPQLDFKMRPEGLALGLTASEVARQVRHSFYGAEALRQQRGRNEVKLMVRLPESERASEHDLDELMIRTPAGTEVPVREVATVTRGRAYTSIERRDGRRVVEVTANVTPPSESENVLQEVLDEAVPMLKERYPGLGQSFAGRQEDLREGIGALQIGFVVAMLGIYALLAIPFRSYAQPLIIMVCIPFGLAGAVLAHILMGYPLSLMSMMGMVALSGVVVNDSLVLINYANERRREGASLHEAISMAGVRRFRPILLTTLTTFLGLAPMIFETSRQARFMVPMAISLGFGIVFSTAVTLVLVPSLYVVLDDIGRVVGAILGRAPKQPAASALQPEPSNAETPTVAGN